ncbi:MAG: hypothetical protein KDD61_10105 [Bdellovibrionales bacterium]|nr:hypothetical protein [Bdellovibrionales bacterium]
MKGLLIWLLLGFAATAVAEYDVICLKGDCLKNGWSIFDTKTGNSSVVKCEDEDCRTKGWVERPKRGIAVAQTSCIDDLCWQEGWVTYNFRTGATISENYCLSNDDGDGDCLKQGWETHFPGGSWARTLCINNDCQEVGWEVHFFGGGFQTSRCKTGGCFKSGWTMYP